GRRGRGGGCPGPAASHAVTASSLMQSSSARKCRHCESAYAPSRSDSRNARTRSSRLVLVDALHLLDDRRIGLLDSLAGLLRRHLDPLGRARDRLRLPFHELDGLLDAVDAAQERLLIQLRRILRAVRPADLSARRGGL